MDKIVIEDLLVRTLIGINEEERRKKQDVVVQITLWADLEPAGRSDRIEDTVNYRSINKAVFDMIEKSRFHLVEALAEKSASLCLEYPKVMKVRVRVDKPGALRFTRTVGVEITRERRA